MMIFLPRPCSTISASTVMPPTVGRPTETEPASSATSSGPNEILVPAGPVSFSTRRVSPSLTRYCFPPDTMTAYMCELPPGERRSLDISRQLSRVVGRSDLQDLDLDLDLDLVADANAVAVA